MISITITVKYKGKKDVCLLTGSCIISLCCILLLWTADSDCLSFHLYCINLPVFFFFFFGLGLSHITRNSGKSSSFKGLFLF